MPTSAPHRRARDPDLLRLRADHAWRYLARVRPAVVVIGMLIATATALVDPDDETLANFALVGWSFLVTAAALLAARRVSAIRVVNATIVLDVLVLYEFIARSDQPQTTVMVLLWPIIAFGYFAGPFAALAMSLLATGSSFLMQATDPHWTDDRVVPGAAYILLISGLLIWFVTREGRRIEHALARDRSLSRSALLLAQRIRLSEDPRASLEEIASGVCSELDARRAIVGLFGHETDYLSELVEWPEATTNAARLDRRAVDPTILRLVASGAGLICSKQIVLVRPRFASPLDIASGDTEDSVDDGAMRAAISTSFGINAPDHTGVLCPLHVGDRAVGFLLACGPATQGWSDATAELLAAVAPQLAAGLAQVVVVRDQRDALAALERIDEMRDRLIASVSHELRTPLTSTIGFVETLLREDVDLSPQTRAELLKHARDGGQRLLSLVEDLLTLGTTRPESLDLQRTPLQPRDLVAAAVVGIDMPDGRQLHVTALNDALVVVDRNRMLQVITNLVVNAVRHGDGDIEIACDAVDHDALIDVIDAGRGIPAEHVRELFLPFASFSSRTDSTGLGLAICRSIVEAHGGSIAYARTDDHRTRFRIRIPAS